MDMRERFEEIICNDAIPFVQKVQEEEVWDFLCSLDSCIGRMKGFAQNNIYHCDDVQIHTAKVVDGIHHEGLREEEYRDLRIAAFFHDVGKPAVAKTVERNGHVHTIFAGHPEKSMELAQPILKKLGYEGEELDRLLFLIVAHDLFLPFQFEDKLRYPERKETIINETNIQKWISRFKKDYPDLPHTKENWCLLNHLMIADAAAHKDIITNDDGILVDTVEDMVKRAKAIGVIFAHMDDMN